MAGESAAIRKPRPRRTAVLRNEQINCSAAVSHVWTSDKSSTKSTSRPIDSVNSLCRSSAHWMLNSPRTFIRFSSQTPSAFGPVWSPMLTVFSVIACPDWATSYISTRVAILIVKNDIILLSSTYLASDYCERAFTWIYWPLRSMSLTRRKSGFTRTT